MSRRSITNRASSSVTEADRATRGGAQFPTHPAEGPSPTEQPSLIQNNLNCRWPSSHRISSPAERPSPAEVPSSTKGPSPAEGSSQQNNSLPQRVPSHRTTLSCRGIFPAGRPSPAGGHLLQNSPLLQRVPLSQNNLTCRGTFCRRTPQRVPHLQNGLRKNRPPRSPV
ncbi:hypothetical protein CDEST_05881 [Colletotrichum destructivum]|uniref:Uncharacterized protein n=1 Tax=Colletotrichum destructivum TaxID=34406 RepID=A0AAX4ICB4_9PEZI|nr:hypothetical protein CDEST_05881 [Colletotrichum destructivum]